ncbi:hypothetical protein PROPEN_01802 [Proteus penneri ATCC 35198]|nr:hypothetical protein PROPEN_01802 [Proteus penneri ATCC 35198]
MAILRQKLMITAQTSLLSLSFFAFALALRWRMISMTPGKIEITIMATISNFKFF